MDFYGISGIPQNQPVRKKVGFGRKVGRFFAGMGKAALGAVPGGNLILSGLSNARGSNSVLGNGPIPGNPGYNDLLQAQLQIQRETLQFTTLTNIAKSRHDAEMSAVRNIRA